MARQRLHEQYVLGKWEGKLQQEVLLATSDTHEMDRSHTNGNKGARNMKGNVYTSNISTRSRNHCCHGRAITITYSKYVSVALVIQQPQHMRHIMYKVVHI